MFKLTPLPMAFAQTERKRQAKASEARVRLAGTPPFCEWAERRHPPLWEAEAYLLVINSLIETALLSPPKERMVKIALQYDDATDFVETHARAN
jgi:hypothetical protein